MRPITGTDIIDFYNGRDDLLVLTAKGEFDHIGYSDVECSPLYGTRADSYMYVATQDGDVQILLERSTIDEGEWFPDALNDDGDLDPAVAQEMADVINSDGIIPGRASKAIHITEGWRKADEAANRLAAKRAAAVAEVVAYCGGNQSKASRFLGLDQSTVNKLVAKHRRVATSGT
jgi:hypothetical protein